MSKLNKQAQGAKQTKEIRVKRSRIKETVSELKKVNWPSFKKTMKQTGMVLTVVSIFVLLVLGIDTLVSYVIKVLTNL